MGPMETWAYEQQQRDGGADQEMSREAFCDPPDREPEFCPNCGSSFYMHGCTHCLTRVRNE
jgi:hypothetical protein